MSRAGFVSAVFFASLTMALCPAAAGGAFGITLEGVLSGPAGYTPGATYPITITFSRTDGTAASDSEVTALGGELTLPAGWSLTLNPDNECAPVPQAGESRLDNQVPGVNPTVHFKQNQSLYSDPPANTQCVPVPEIGNMLELFFIEDDSESPLPLDFPIIVKATLTVPPASSGTKSLSLRTLYRVGAGGGQVDTAPTLNLSNGGGVSIPDAGLEAALREALAQPSGPLQSEDLATLTALDASSRGITSLTGLAFCTGLTELDLSGNNFSSLSALAGLTGLETLNINGNLVANVNPLAGLSGLVTLHADDNIIISLGPLTGLTGLNRLDLAGNQISDISALPGLTNLSLLELSRNTISDVSPLSGLTTLTQLGLDHNEIAGISSLSGLVNLNYLSLGYNDITDIAPLSGLSLLTYFSITENAVADVEVLLGLDNLETLFLDSNLICDIGPLRNNLGIGAGDSVNLAGNPLSAQSCGSHIATITLRGAAVDSGTACAGGGLVECGSEGEGEGAIDTSEPVSGFVLDGRDNGPIEGATVTLFRSGSSQVLDTGVSAQDGSYLVFAPDAVTSVDLLFAAPGFQSRRVFRKTAPTTVTEALTFIAPVAPAGLEAFPAVDSVTLSWQPSTGLNVAGYRVYRGIGAAPSSFGLVTTSPVTDTRYEDAAGLVRGNTYSYYVTAVDTLENESSPSATVQATPGVVVMSIPFLNAKPGEMLRVPLNVRNAIGLGISGMQIDFRYPAQWLGADPTAQQAAAENIRVERTVLTQQAAITVNADVPGRILILGVSTSSQLVGEGHLFNVFLPVSPDAVIGSCGNLDYENVTFASNTVPPQSLPIEFEGPWEGCIKSECSVGDLNGDGVADILDVIYALQVSTQLVGIDDCAVDAGELDGDGSINSGDAVLLLRRLAELSLNPTPEEKDAIEEFWRAKGGATQVAIGAAAPGGGVVILPVTVTNAAGISGFDLTVTYPQSTGIVNLESVTLAGIAQQFTLEQSQDPGVLRVSMSRQDPLEVEDGQILALEFTVSPQAPPGAQLPIVLSAVELRGQYGENLKWFGAVGRADGAILVGGTAVIDSHQGDWDGGNSFSLSEVLRIVQLYNVGSYGCDAGTEDGFAPGSADRICSPHTADYQNDGPDWTIALPEVLRIIQLYNAEGFELCEGGEDGFCIEGA